MQSIKNILDSVRFRITHYDVNDTPTHEAYDQWLKAGKPNAPTVAAKKPATTQHHNTSRHNTAVMHHSFKG